MGVNLDKPARWKQDVAQSVDLYNDWFLKFAPKTYRETRVQTTKDVEHTLDRTDKLRNVSPELLIAHPAVLFTLRMCTAPPIARDRLIGLARISSKNLIDKMEKDGVIPLRMSRSILLAELQKICLLVMKLADADIFPWLADKREPTELEFYRAATIVADRLCGACADPIIRNAQERRQLQAIKQWLEARNYRDVSGSGVLLETMAPGTFCFRLAVEGLKDDGESVNIPIDAIVMSRAAKGNELPLMIEAKSAGDFTNTNKRRKEEATKVVQLRKKFGRNVRFILFLCGYFDSGYLGYEASEGLDWVWEHRINDLAEFGV